MQKFQPYKKTANSEKIVISIRIDENKVKEIDEIANKIDISRNEFIIQCVEYALDNIEFNENKQKEND